MLTRIACCVFCCAAVASSATVFAQMVVPANADVALHGGALDLAATDLHVAGALSLGTGQLTSADNIFISAGGQLDAGSGAVTLFGDWSNAGTFTAGTSTVSFADGAAMASLSGDSAFHNLSFVSSTGKTYIFAVGSTQSINGMLTILGAPAQPIQVASSAAGQVASINLLPSGTQNIDYVGVSDVYGIGQALAPTKSNDGGSGNDRGWFGNALTPSAAATPVPTLSRLAQLLLGLLLFGTTFFFSARSRRAKTTTEILS